MTPTCIVHGSASLNRWVRCLTALKSVLKRRRKKKIRNNNNKKKKKKKKKKSVADPTNLCSCHQIHIGGSKFTVVHVTGVCIG